MQFRYPARLQPDLSGEITVSFRDSGLSRLAFARRLGVDEKVVRRMLDPRHHTAANRIHKALRSVGRELIVKFRAAKCE